MSTRQLPRIITLSPSFSPAELAAVVEVAIAVLRAGGTVIYPTETVYGIGVDATNPAAVEKVLAFKARREGKPLSIAVTNQSMAEHYVKLNQQAITLYRRFLPGPVTVVSESLDTVAPGVASEFHTLGVRIPDHPVIMALVTALGKPITATSANGSGEKRPYQLSDIWDHLSDAQLSKVDLAIDFGILPPNPPSTVIDTTLSTPLIMRQGAAEVVSEQATDVDTVSSNNSTDTTSPNKKTKTITFTSHSPEETRSIAGRWLLKYWDQIKTTGLIIGLNGSLGAGKTVFAQGVGQFLQLTEPVISPTYTYILEYPYLRHGQAGWLQHVDAWKIDTTAEFERLQLTHLVRPGTVLLIEWWSQIAASALAQKTGFAPETPIITIDIQIPDQNTRELHIAELR